MSEKGSIYKITVGDSFRKAIDVEALKMFIEKKKLEFSLLNMDSKLLENTSIDKLAFRAALETIQEIEAVCDNALGLNKVEEAPTDEVSDEVTEPGNILPEGIKDVAEKVADAENESDSEEKLIL
jgi:hypothetical protein